MALVPPFFLDCVVAIGIIASDGTSQWVASGFLYGEVETEKPEKLYRIYLVTNRHVLREQKKVKLRFNPEEAQPAREYDLELQDPNGSPLWLTHSDHDIDVAVIPINAQFLREQKIKFQWFQSDQHIADRAKASQLGITEGDGIFVLGFPLGLIGGERNFVIVRQGVIARIRDALSGSSKEFLADTFIFPGNSGGPVVTKPEPTAITGTQAVTSAYLTLIRK